MSKYLYEVAYAIHSDMGDEPVFVGNATVAATCGGEAALKAREHAEQQRQWDERINPTFHIREVEQVGEVETLRVAFRAERSGPFKGDVTAVLPDNEATPGRIVCYAHVGQHSEGDWGWYYKTRAAKPEEYAFLLRELEQRYAPEYDLRVVHRITR